MTRATYHDLPYSVVPQLLEDIPMQTTVLCAIVSIPRFNFDFLKTNIRSDEYSKAGRAYHLI